MALKKIDTLVVWQKSGTNEYGKSTFAPPAEIKGRWDDLAQRMDDDKGKEFVSKASIYTDEPLISLGDRVRPMCLAETDGLSLDKSFIVKATKHSRNGSGTRHLYTSYLDTPK